MNSTALHTTPAKPVDLPVAGVLRRKCACGRSAKGADVECEICKQQHALGLQRQLSIGASDDPLEHEAERTAKRILASAASDLQPRASALPIQRASTLAAPAQAPASVASTLASTGEALAPAARLFFEPRFGDHQQLQRPAAEDQLRRVITHPALGRQYLRLSAAATLAHGADARTQQRHLVGDQGKQRNRYRAFVQSRPMNPAAPGGQAAGAH
ncbi:hypothetical protein [Aquipseudomonas alcaligenes]|uniref:Uncharacterized protein n=1 Tax=Aquipseudomonas alcaligenes TaxID=43263 RepID=A0A1N6T5T5_AQUAC|nr:hypothetical protein [Pseudomonas alcaligenes]SIQ48712.1 hypothetical protein SAMN05878282_104326 [Pseudomonas alcaligenes]